MSKNTVAALVLAATTTLAASAAALPGTASSTAQVGFVVLAPDRGFQGNEEAREAFAPFAARHAARLVFVTDERTAPYLERAVADLRDAGAERQVLLPLFLSPAHPRLDLARRLAAEIAPGAAWGRPYGATYLAVEALADRLRAAEAPSGGRLVVVTSGAEDVPSREAMTGELARLAELAATGFGFADVTALVGPAGAADLESLEDHFVAELEVATGPGDLVVSFDQGAELDGMMSFGAWLRRRLPEGAALLDAPDVTPDPLVTLWLEREANRYLPLSPERLGVVALAHGSDFHWNETMREAVAPLAGRYLVEPCFSMADRDLVEHAIRRLEERGAQAVAVVRIFGMAESFRGSVERMLGLDVEGPAGLAAPASEEQGGHGHHGHGPASGPPAPRIRTALPAATAGGLEDHPLFARALLDRARALSRDPSREVVLLVAHGLGDDAGNDHWERVLASIAAQMDDAEGAAFADIETVTWREDWPDKREPSVARAREIVERAAAAGRRVLVIPARTTGQGPAAELLEGLDFVLGEGFAPHPLFAEWVDGQVLEAAHELPLDGEARGLLTELAGRSNRPGRQARPRVDVSRTIGAGSDAAKHTHHGGDDG